MLLEFNNNGIYCKQADVYIDPWRKVNKAIITHAHSDHARWGMNHYLAHKDSVPIMKHRLGAEISVESKNYVEKFNINGVDFTLYPAGHIIGSSQVLVEYRGEKWLVTGDYKTEDDGYSTPFELIKCDTIITECTFGLPIYKWIDQREVFEEINSWWRENQQQDKASVLTAYSLGKAQRVINGVDSSIGRIFTHGAVDNINKVLIESGHSLPETILVNKDIPKLEFKGSLVICPPSAIGSPWIKKFGSYSLGIASGWMALRGTRRRRAADRGFVLSDHADWDGLNNVVDACGAEKVIATHGYTDIFARYLREEKGLNAVTEKTQFEGEGIDNDG